MNSAVLLQRSKRFPVEPLVDIFLGFWQGGFYESRRLPELDERLNALPVDAASRRKTELPAGTFLIILLGAGAIAFVFRKKNLDHFLVVVGIRHPVGGPNHRANEPDEEIFMTAGPVAPGRAETARVMRDVVFRFGKYFEAALLDLLIAQPHHRADSFAALDGFCSSVAVAESLERVVPVQFEPVLFENRDHDNSEARRRRIHCESFAANVFISPDAGIHGESLFNTLAAAEKNDEVVRLRVGSLTLGPGNHIVGVIEDEVVTPADQVAEQGRRVGYGIDFDADVFVFEESFFLCCEDHCVFVEESDSE